MCKLIKCWCSEKSGVILLARRISSDFVKQMILRKLFRIGIVGMFSWWGYFRTNLCNLRVTVLILKGLHIFVILCSRELWMPNYYVHSRGKNISGLLGELNIERMWQQSGIEGKVQMLTSLNGGIGLTGCLGLLLLSLFCFILLEIN